MHKPLQEALTLRRILPFVCFLVIAVFLSVPFWPKALDLVLELGQKTAVYGSNSRLREVATLSALWVESPSAFLFCHGWGATYRAPAVGLMEVGYTHGFWLYVPF